MLQKQHLLEILVIRVVRVINAWLSLDSLDINHPFTIEQGKEDIDAASFYLKYYAFHNVIQERFEQNYR